MYLVHHSFDTIQDNIAWDETALVAMKSGCFAELIRLWQTSSRSVVIGRSQTVEDEVFMHACHRDRVPVIRRFSGGGAVVQGPEVMNYTFILDLKKHRRLSSIRDYFSYCLEIVRTVLLKANVPSRFQGSSDLTDNDGRKFSGNSLAVRGRALCVHGTLILSPLASSCQTYLRYPTRVPDYRRGRKHNAFLTSVSEKNSALDIHCFREILMAEYNFQAEDIAASGMDVPNRLLVRKYNHSTWNIHGKHPQGGCTLGKTA